MKRNSLKSRIILLNCLRDNKVVKWNQFWKWLAWSVGPTVESKNFFDVIRRDSSVRNVGYERRRPAWKYFLHKVEQFSSCGKNKNINSGDLKSWLVWISKVEKRLGYKWSRFWMGSEIWKPNHLKSKQMTAIMSKTIWNLDKIVWYSDTNVFYGVIPWTMAV